MPPQNTFKEIINQLPVTETNELPEKLKQLHELRIGEQRPKAPLLSRYSFTPAEEIAYDRIIKTLRRQTSAARITDHFKPFNAIATHFGGQPYAEQDDRWPDCQKCKSSLNFVGQLNFKSILPDGTSGTLLYVVYYCFRCFPSTNAPGSGFEIFSYWNPTLAAAEPIEPEHNLSARQIAPAALQDISDVFYLPSVQELDVEEIGLPIQFYLKRFDGFIDDLKKTATVISGGFYPAKAQSPKCGECGNSLEVVLTMFYAGVFSLLYCPNHPLHVVGYRTSFDDCAVGPVQYSVYKTVEEFEKADKLRQEKWNTRY
jgi:hypothetical protein